MPRPYAPACGCPATWPQKAAATPQPILICYRRNCLSATDVRLLDAAQANAPVHCVQQATEESHDEPVLRCFVPIDGARDAVQRTRAWLYEDSKQAASIAGPVAAQRAALGRLLALHDGSRKSSQARQGAGLDVQDIMDRGGPSQ